MKHGQKSSLSTIPSFLITDDSYLNFLALGAVLVDLGCSRLIFKRLPSICRFFFFSAASSSSSSAFRISVSAKRRGNTFFFPRYDLDKPVILIYNITIVLELTHRNTSLPLF